MELTVKNEDLDICRECGGMCCLKCGCDYAAWDFIDKSYNALLEVLNSSDKSIVAMINFTTLATGKFVAEPTLYIRARNVNRDMVDLVSMKTKCASLGSNGCVFDYEHRPFGGKNLKPVRECNGACEPIVSPLDILSSWKPYQKQLSKIVKHYTGKSVDEKINEDVEELLYRVLIKDYSDVSEAERRDLKGFVLLLIKAYPELYKRALDRYKKVPYARTLHKN